MFSVHCTILTTAAPPHRTYTIDKNTVRINYSSRRLICLLLVRLKALVQGSSPRTSHIRSCALDIMLVLPPEAISVHTTLQTGVEFLDTH